MKRENAIHGIKIRTINIILMIVFCGLSIISLVSSLESQHNYNSMFYDVSDYTDCTKAISNFKDASDYLTNQSRSFAIHKDISFLKNYFDERDVLQRRERAVEIIEMSHEDDDPIKNLRLAMEESEDLAKKEFYAMKLICLSAFSSMDGIPEIVQDVQLSESDANLPSSKKIELAQEMLFDASYINSKDRITKYTANALSSLSAKFSTQFQLDDRRISRIFVLQKVWCTLFFIASILLFVMVITLVVIPLDSHVERIKNGEKMILFGSYELKYIAKTYNELCEKNLIKENMLKHKAEHDPLTELINREAFGHIKEIFKESTDPIAYLLIDIDFFKKINDTYGHLVGDQVLKKIAKLLIDQFRNTDYVARVGGDEFAVIMTKFGDRPELVIQRKIDGLNKMLQIVTDGLPPVSLSVGVSFSECGFKGVLEEQADKALYRVKNGGRCNCSFYDYIELN